MNKINIVLIIFGLVVSIILCEIMLRVLPKNVTKIDFSSRSDIRIFSSTRTYKYKPNTARNFTGLGPPVIWHFNNWGFRDRSFETNEVEGKVYRITVIGDSVVMGFGVEDYEAFPRRLEKILSPKKFSGGPQFFEVFNQKGL